MRRMAGSVKLRCSVSTNFDGQLWAEHVNQVVPPQGADFVEKVGLRTRFLLPSSLGVWAVDVDLSGAHSRCMLRHRRSDWSRF